MKWQGGIGQRKVFREIPNTFLIFVFFCFISCFSGNAAIVNIPHPDSDTILSLPVPDDFLIGPSNHKIMRDHMYLAPFRKLRVQASALMTGSGLSILFPDSSEPVVIIDSGVTFSLSNVTLRNFSPKHVRYIDTTSKLHFGPNIIIELAEDSELKAEVGGIPDTPITWTFKTDSTKAGAIIKGYRRVLDLGETSPVAIQIEPNATVTLQKLRLVGLGGEQKSPNSLFGTKPYNFRLMHPDSRLVLRDSRLFLSGNYSVSEGKIDVYEDNIISGTFTFAYQSPNNFTIQKQSKLILDRSVTFSYDPIAVMSKNLLVFASDSSGLIMNGATLHTTTTGLNLTRGYLLIDHEVIFSSEVQTKIQGGEETLIDEGITIGNETAGEDFVCEICNGGRLKLSSGSLNYKNVASDSWVIDIDTSELELCACTKLNLYRTLESNKGRVVFGQGSILRKASGVSLLIPMNCSGRIVHETLS